MKVVRSGSELRQNVLAARRSGLAIGFVPTMGALHEGHVSLVRAARASTEVVVVSIFVNPLQFGPGEDLVSYPRSEDKDLELAKGAGTDIVFMPSSEEMYPGGPSTFVNVGELATVLEGRDRPGHFEGVATVVAKLFNLVDPDVAFFGQKDAQQVAVIQQMVRDLSFPIEIRVEPTVREVDGLALSSRNAYLSADERSRAGAMYQALLEGAEILREEDVEHAEKIMWELLVADGFEPTYTKVVDPKTFGPPDSSGAVLLVIAARLGATRLIDNLLVQTR